MYGRHNIKKAVYSLLALTVIVTLFHDGGAYANARRTLVEGTRAAATGASMGQGDRNAGARTALEIGAQHGVTVIAYDEKNRRVEVWAQTEVEGTWVLARITGYVENRPSDRPYVIQHVETAPIR